MNLRHNIMAILIFCEIPYTLYQSTILFIILAQWSMTLIDPEIKSAWDICTKFWNNFLNKSYFYKMIISFALWTYIFIICYLIFIIKLFRFDLRNYPSVLSHLNCHTAYYVSTYLITRPKRDNPACTGVVFLNMSYPNQSYCSCPHDRASPVQLFKENNYWSYN